MAMCSNEEKRRKKKWFMKEQQNHRTLSSLTFTLSKVTFLASPYSILYFIYLYSVKNFLKKGKPET